MSVDPGMAFLLGRDETVKPLKAVHQYWSSEDSQSRCVWRSTAWVHDLIWESLSQAMPLAIVTWQSPPLVKVFR